jgi:hypothetical protein
LTRGRHNERTTRGNATTSWHDEVTRGRCDERRHNLVVFPVQMESNGKVVAMVVAHIERKPDFFFIWDESQVVSDVVQKGIRTLGHHKDQQAKLAHPFVRVLGGPKQFWLADCPKFVQQRTLPSSGRSMLTLMQVSWLILQWQEHFLYIIYPPPPNSWRWAPVTGGTAKMDDFCHCFDKGLRKAKVY